MAVITISRQFGSGGEEITNRVCQVLGCRLFNKRMIETAAEEAGLSRQDAIDYHEENYKVRSFFERLFGGSRAASVSLWPEDIATLRTIEEQRQREQDAYQLVRKAIWTAYENGNVIIAGRGGQMILKDCPGVLHVRIEASMEVRLERVKKALRQSTHKYDTDAELQRSAQEAINARDAASADYIRRFYSVEWNDPLLYHLVINTARLSVEQSVQLITKVAPWV